MIKTNKEKKLITHKISVYYRFIIIIDVYKLKLVKIDRSQWPNNGYWSWGKKWKQTKWKYKLMISNEYSTILSISHSLVIVITHAYWVNTIYFTFESSRLSISLSLSIIYFSSSVLIVVILYLTPHEPKTNKSCESQFHVFIQHCQ